MKTSPRRKASGVDVAAPTLVTPLWPVPTPRISRPPLSASTEAAAPAVMAGARVTKLVTHAASETRSVRSAARASATHTSIALPGVSAMPTRSQPRDSPSDTMRAVYAGV